MGARLTFDTSGGGNYVSASYQLPTPIYAGALSLWVRHPGGVNVQIRVVDSTGQTLHYSPNRPFEATVASHFYRIIQKLGASSLHWGGVNDGNVHLPIVAVSILAKPTLNQTGYVDFDEIDAMALPMQVNPSANVWSTGVADLDGSAGVEIEHIEANASCLDLAQSLGFKWIRTEFFWTDVETSSGVYDFSWYDQLEALLAARGMNAHFILCYGNAIYTGTDWFQPPLTPSAMAGFANFAKAAAAHFAGQGVQFEVWNEPDNATFWAAPSPSLYAQLAKTVIPQVQAGDANTRVSTGGLAGIDLGYLQRIVAAGAAQGAYAVALHPYRTAVPETFADDLVETHTRLVSAGCPTTRIWSTEAGYSSAWYGDGSAADNRTLEAKYGARQILTAAGLGIPFQVVFALHDHGTDFFDPEDNFGIVDNSDHPKPLTAAVQTLLAQCANKTLLGNLQPPESSLHILKFQSATGVLLVLWSDNTASQVEAVPFTETPSLALDYQGNPLAVTACANGQSSVPVGDSPVYVSFP